MKLRWSDVTPKAQYLNRRAFIAAGAVAMAAPAWALTGKPSAYSTVQKPNTLEEITNYNNFYEFGMDKTDPARHAGAMTTDPWSVEIGGMVDRPGSYGVDDLAPANALEERIYRLRCVEAWSMVVPWIGVPLASVLAKVGVQPSAKFVEFETLVRPEEMIGQQRAILDWPYREGLRLDEAMHPLTLLTLGMYGHELPKQNGAPVRVMVPWKYGFKSPKSIVAIRLVESEPRTAWNKAARNEYGFYSNVNPEVDHPRWSQATERRIGEGGLLAPKRKTQLFNGYEEQVARLYAGMDLKKFY